TRAASMSVMIPGGNEAQNMEACVRSVLAAAYEPIEVVVVDDRSTDDTAAIVERVATSPEARGRVRLVRGAELPAGWFGKPWAVVRGYSVSRGVLSRLHE